MTDPNSKPHSTSDNSGWGFIALLGLPALLFFGLPLVVPLSDGTYSCEALGAPFTMAPPNVEVVDGRIVKAYRTITGDMNARDMKEEYDFFWKSTLTVTLDGLRYTCTL